MGTRIPSHQLSNGLHISKRQDQHKERQPTTGSLTPHLRKGMMESSSGISLARAEAFLRLFAILVLVLTACLLGFDTQTKLLFSTIKKTATFRDLGALQVVVYVDSVAAGYNLLQLGRGFISAKLKGKLINVSYVTLPWVCFLLDQAAVYTVFSANTAALQASIIAVTGESSLQWMKVCNRYTRFCIQVGGALLSGYLASLLMCILETFLLKLRIIFIFLKDLTK
ncbi:unnamed protein product, partial [Vitis vinifera]